MRLVCTSQPCGENQVFCFLFVTPNSKQAINSMHQALVALSSLSLSFADSRIAQRFEAVKWFNGFSWIGWWMCCYTAVCPSKTPHKNNKISFLWLSIIRQELFSLLRARGAREQSCGSTYVLTDSFFKGSTSSKLWSDGMTEVWTNKYVER